MASDLTKRETFELGAIRPLFPALSVSGPTGKPWVYLDGPGGTQVPSSVAESISQAILFANANRGASFATSQAVDGIMARAGLAAAALLGVDGADRVVFGQNMTSLAFHAADAIIPTLKPGDEVVVSNLDHDANVAPWVHAAQRSGATVRRLDFDSQSMTLSPAQLANIIGRNTRLIAFTAASNALGSLTPVPELVRVARASPALVIVDGTHYAPHLLPNVDAWDIDLFFCSAYKFFGPHVGLMAGKREVLHRLNPAKVRPASNLLPVRWMTGTQNHEGIAGVTAAIEYLASLGNGLGLREKLATAYQRIADHERDLMEVFLHRLGSQHAWTLTGVQVADPARRVATFALRGPVDPATASRLLAEKGICSYAGNFYALPVTEALGLEAKGGFLRVGAVHYNTADEIHRLWDELEALKA
ncbi:MAG: cysteine desulfurase-like protein, partial [Gemmataceae bacterium]